MHSRQNVSLAGERNITPQYIIIDNSGIQIMVDTVSLLITHFSTEQRRVDPG